MEGKHVCPIDMHDRSIYLVYYKECEKTCGEQTSHLGQGVPNAYAIAPWTQSGRGGRGRGSRGTERIELPIAIGVKHLFPCAQILNEKPKRSIRWNRNYQK